MKKYTGFHYLVCFFILIIILDNQNKNLHLCIKFHIWKDNINATKILTNVILRRESNESNWNRKTYR